MTDVSCRLVGRHFRPLGSPGRIVEHLSAVLCLLEKKAVTRASLDKGYISDKILVMWRKTGVVAFPSRFSAEDQEMRFNNVKLPPVQCKFCNNKRDIK